MTSSLFVFDSATLQPVRVQRLHTSCRRRNVPVLRPGSRTCGMVKKSAAEKKSEQDMT